MLIRCHAVRQHAGWRCTSDPWINPRSSGERSLLARMTREEIGAFRGCVTLTLKRADPAAILNHLLRTCVICLHLGRGIRLHVGHEYNHDCCRYLCKNGM